MKKDQDIIAISYALLVAFGAVGILAIVGIIAGAWRQVFTLVVCAVMVWINAVDIRRTKR